jgi:hypothetical protein
MDSPPRILHLEDDSKDAELVQEMLKDDGIACQVTRVETQAHFIACLDINHVEAQVDRRTPSSPPGFPTSGICGKRGAPALRWAAVPSVSPKRSSIGRRIGSFLSGMPWI